MRMQGFRESRELQHRKFLRRMATFIGHKEISSNQPPNQSKAYSKKLAGRTFKSLTRAVNTKAKNIGGNYFKPKLSRNNCIFITLKRMGNYCFILHILILCINTSINSFSTMNRIIKELNRPFQKSTTFIQTHIQHKHQRSFKQTQ